MNAPAFDLTNPEVQHAIKRTLYESSFYDFVKEAWQHVDNAPFVPNWHIEVICDHLQAVVEGKINRLLINIPPGSGKSLIANVLFPAWGWARNPQMQIINTSFSMPQSTRDTVRSRRLITSEWFQKYWPLKLQDDQNQKGKYENTEGGIREAKPFTNITGSRANIVIVDDPISVENANSAAERASAARTFWNSVQSRLNDPARDAIICIMQRVHEDDVAGTIIAKNEQKKGKHGYYEHLCIPAEFDGVERSTSLGKYDPRTELGELFFEKRFSKETLEDYKSSMGPIQYAGQYQQSPAPLGDGFLRKDYFHTYGVMDCEACHDGETCGQIHQLPKNLRYFLTSDHAPAGTSTADFNVVRVWGMDEKRNLWLVDSFRQQCTMDIAMGVTMHGGNVQLAREGALPFIKKYRPSAWFAENDNTWKAIYPQLKVWMLETNCFTTIVPLSTAGNKMTKAQPYQALAALGQIYLPEGELGETALLEYMLFPQGTNDDQVDADGMLPRALNDAHPAVAAAASGNIATYSDYNRRPRRTERLSDSDTFF